MSVAIFNRITTAAMARSGFHRYGVRYRDRFIGEIFQFKSPNGAIRWMVQSANGGVVHGWSDPLESRLEAADVLIIEDRKERG